MATQATRYKGKGGVCVGAHVVRSYGQANQNQAARWGRLVGVGGYKLAVVKVPAHGSSRYSSKVMR